MESCAPGPDDDPFEWLGRGILTDQRNFAEQNPTNKVTVPTHEGNNNFAKLHTASPEDDPFEILGRGILIDQTGLSQQTSTSNDLAPNFAKVSNPSRGDEILVEDVFSVDENQFDASDVPESDVSYVPQELFPSAASQKLARVPSTIHEGDFTDGVSKTDTDSGPSQQQPENANIDVAADCSHTRDQHQTKLFIKRDHKFTTDEFKDLGYNQKACSEGSDRINGNTFLSLNEAPSVFDAPPSVITSTASQREQQHLSPDLQSTSNEADIRCLFTEKQKQPQIQQLKSDTELGFTASLFELPPENIGYQYTAPPDRAPFAVSAGETNRLNSHTGLRFSSPLFELPLENIEYQQTPPPLIDITSSAEMNIGIAQSNPSAAATITTAASTYVGDDSDSAKSEILLREEVVKDDANRRLEENYALFNDDEIFLKNREDNAARDQDGSMDSPEEFLITTKKKGRGKSSSSRNNHSSTSLDSDEENIVITPGMVGYTGFDEDEENMLDKKSRERSKPKTKKTIVFSAIIIIALLTAVSVLLSIVLKKTREISSNSNNASGIETSESGDIAASPSMYPTGDSGIRATVSSHVLGDGSPDESESTAPSIQPNQPSASSAPSLSLVETALIMSTVTPSFAPELSSAAPTLKPSITIVYSTSTTSKSDTSSRPSSGEYHYTTTESTGMHSTFATSALPTLMPSSEPTSTAPTIFNASIISSNATYPTCNGSVTSSNISESVSFGFDDQPCASFFVDICIDDSAKGANWAIVQLLTTESFSPSPTPLTQDSWRYDDGWYYDDHLNYDDNWNYDDVLFDDSLTNHSAINENQDQRNNSSMFNEEGMYFSDENFTVAGNNSAQVCLPKGTYNFIMSESTNEFALYFGNGRPVRPMSRGNYSDEILDITPFEVTTFDVLGVGTESTTTPFPIFQANASSSYDDNSTGLITSSGDDLVHDIGKAYGIIFDVETGLKSLTISSIELYLDTSFPVHFEVHTKNGSWKQDEVISGFREVSHGTIVGGGVCQDTKNCTFARIPNEDFESLVLPSGSRQTFYITSTTDDLVFQHFVKDGASGINFADIVQASSPELTVYLGAAVLAYPLALADPTTDFRPGGFIGRLIYEALDVVNVSLHDNFVPAVPEPISQTDNECYYYTEDSCRNAAKKLGLSLGGLGFPFAGHFGQSGCYFYPCSNCLFGGHAYFGKSSDKISMESTQTFHSERRLDCTTNVDNLSKDTSFWCLLTSNICNF
ncbi:hypothetical protein ACHAW6_008467 [Cyclotella cf. meneghiniana]